MLQRCYESLKNNCPETGMQSRQVLKEHLKKTIAEGAEVEYLREAEDELSRLQTELQQLQERRANLRRQITIRERKLLDWKGKIPRAHGALPSVVEVAESVSTMPSAACHEIGRISELNSENGKTLATLIVTSHFRTGIKGLAGFEKAWVVLANKKLEHGEFLHDDDNDDDNDSVACGVNEMKPIRGSCMPSASGVDLVLVDVVNCDECSGTLIVALTEPSIGRSYSYSLVEATVIDIKPYLSYCDSQ